MRRLFMSVLVLVGLTIALPAQDLKLPLKDGSVKFAVIGDTGTGDNHQLAIAKQLTTYRGRFPFDFVIMLGDNLYGGNSPKDYDKKFAMPYKPLLDGGVRFFALDSNYMDDKQLFWLDEQLVASGSDWKICFFHHPPYSSGEAHGSDLTLRNQVEPVFVKYGVNVVFTGHEHFYERIKPQKGIAYFIAGSSAKLRAGTIPPPHPPAKGLVTA